VSLPKFLWPLQVTASAALRYSPKEVLIAYVKMDYQTLSTWV
jgi:hypothetical protein